MFIYIKFSPNSAKTLASYFHQNNQNITLLNNHSIIKSKHNLPHVTLDIPNDFNYENYLKKEVTVTVIGHVVNDYGFAYIVTIPENIFNKECIISNKKYLHITMVLNKVKPVYCRFMMEKYMGIQPKENISEIDYAKYESPFNINGKLFL